MAFSLALSNAGARCEEDDEAALSFVKDGF
jgi:hypothetical protein